MTNKLKKSISTTLISIHVTKVNIIIAHNIIIEQTILKNTLPLLKLDLP